jgi:hypothetical protein
VERVPVGPIPQGFDRIRIARPLKDGEPLMFRMWLRSGVGPVMIADFVMVDAHGHVVIQVDGFHMIEVKSGTGVVGKAEIPPGTNLPGSPNCRTRVPRSSRGALSSRPTMAALPLIDQPGGSINGAVGQLLFDPAEHFPLLQTHRPANSPAVIMESMIEAASLARRANVLVPFANSSSPTA